MKKIYLNWAKTKRKENWRLAPTIPRDIRKLSNNDGNGKGTSLENKHLGNGDYSMIIAPSSHLLLLTEHATSGLVEAPLKKI